jgi:hypothetical protein
MAKGAMKELQWWKMFQKNVARTKFSHFLKGNFQSSQMIFLDLLIPTLIALFCDVPFKIRLFLKVQQRGLVTFYF